MSDLGRLRRRLLRVEQTGKRLKREIEQIKGERDAESPPLTRTEESRALRLEAEYQQARKDWTRLHDALAAEERRLIDNPTGFLRFS